MRVFPGDPVPQHFVSPRTDLDIKLLLKCLGLTVKESDKGEKSDTEQLCFGAQVGNPAKGDLGGVSEGTEIWTTHSQSTDLSRWIYWEGFSLCQPAPAVEVSHCDTAVSQTQSLWEFPFHLLVLQIFNLRVPSSSGSQTHLKSQAWNDFLYLNPFQKNRLWLRGFIHHLPAPAKLNEPHLSWGGIPSWISESRTQWEPSDTDLEPHNVGRLSGVSGLF